MSRQAQKPVSEPVSLTFLPTAPLLRKADEIERQRQALTAAIDKARATQRHHAHLQHITRTDLATTKDLLSQIIDKIDLDPRSLTCRIHYKILCV